jgi:anti-sigma factor RsiW
VTNISHAELEAYRDGELSFRERRRVERALQGDPALRRRLAALESIGTLLREADAEAETPDLWADIRLRLVQEDAKREAAADARSWLAAWRRPLGVVALGAAAAASVALALLLTPEAAAPPSARPTPAGSVRWIDARGNPMMVLRDDREATIIWVPERDS